jgi:hypothetical protein
MSFRMRTSSSFTSNQDNSRVKVALADDDAACEGVLEYVDLAAEEADEVRLACPLGRRLKGKFGRNFLLKTNEENEDKIDLYDIDDVADLKENQWLLRPNL